MGDDGKQEGSADPHDAEATASNGDGFDQATTEASAPPRTTEHSQAEISGAFDLSDFQPAEGHVQFTPGPSSEERRKTRRIRSRRRRVIGYVLLGAGLFVLAFAGWVGWRALEAYQHLQASETIVDKLQSSIDDTAKYQSGDVGQLVAQLQVEADAARSAVDDPLFGLARHLPAVGPNLTALHEIAFSVSDVANGVSPAATALSELQGSTDPVYKDGQLNLPWLVEASGSLQRASAASTSASARMSAVSTKGLVEPVRVAVDRVATKTADLATQTDSAARTARLLLPMAGGSGPRRYLLVFQNSAEPRATGGIFGSYAVLVVQGGRASIESQAGTSRTLPVLKEPIASLSTDQLLLYSDRLARYPMDTNFTPDFPTAAALFSAMYTKETADTVDGVLAIDPTALSYLLGKENIPVGHGLTVNSGNVAAVVMSEAYRLFPTAADSVERDRFLSDVTTAVLGRFTDGAVPVASLVAGLDRAAGERRILVWSKHESEQADLLATQLSGSLVEDATSTPTVGVFVNDGTGAKLGYYLDGQVALTPGRCVAGAREMTATVTLTYSAPSSGLPEYVLGGSLSHRPYTLQVNLLVFAPTGASIGGLSTAGSSLPDVRAHEGGREVAEVTVSLEPRTTAQVVVTLSLPPDAQPPVGTLVTPLVVTTPGVKTWDTTVEPSPACAR